MKNSSIKTQFTRLVNAVDDYTMGTISKRGMQGVFNLYGKQFVNSVSSAIPGILTRGSIVNFSKLGVATIASSYISNRYW